MPWAVIQFLRLPTLKSGKNGLPFIKSVRLVENFNCPNLISKMAKANFRNLWSCARLLGEKSLPWETIVEGEIHFKQALSSHQIIVLVGIHLGVIEASHALPNSIGDRPFYIAMTPTFSIRFTNWLIKKRSKKNKKTVLLNSSNESVFALRQLFRENGILADVLGILKTKKKFLFSSKQLAPEIHKIIYSITMEPNYLTP